MTIERWVYKGERLGRGDKIAYVYADEAAASDPMLERWFTKSLMATVPVGGIIEVDVEVTDDKVSVRGGHQRRLVDYWNSIEVSNWVVATREARNIVELAKRARSEAKGNPLEHLALSDVRAAYKRRLPTNRAAYLAVILDYICN